MHLSQSGPSVDPRVYVLPPEFYFHIQSTLRQEQFLVFKLATDERTRRFNILLSVYVSLLSNGQAAEVENSIIVLNSQKALGSG